MRLVRGGGCGAGRELLRCRQELLVDVVLENRAASPRQTFETARDLAARIPGLPAFAELRERLGAPGPVLVALPRASGLIAREVFATHGLVASLYAHAPSFRKKPRRGWRLAAAAVAMAGAWVLAYVAVSGSLAPAVRKPSPPSAPTAATRPEVPAPLTSQEVGKRALPAVVQLSCKGKTGAGFFIDESTVITNAHVTCDGDDALEVRLHDGRRLVGTVKHREPLVDLARITVVGAAVEPLPVGSAVLLEPGEKLVFIGSPLGMGFTLHDASVSFVGRPLLGVAYLQMQGSINPGNSGGPVLDSQGRVVGIVTLKVTNAEGIGLALPIEYVQPPVDPSAKAAWAKILAEVDQDDREQEEKLDLVYDRPMLVGIDRSQGAVLAVILQRWSDVPHATVESFTLSRSGRTCQLKATFSAWVALDKVQEDRRTRELRWLLQRAEGGRELFVGLGALQGDCVSAAWAGPGYLALTRGSIEYGRVDLTTQPPPPAMNRPPWQQRSGATAVRRAPGPTPDDRQLESSWRRRFAEARARISRVEGDVARAKAEMERMGPNVVNDANPTLGARSLRLQQLQDVIDHADERTREAEAALAELERQAALDSVPLEWRR